MSIGNTSSSRAKTYFALSDSQNHLVGTAWNITQRSGSKNSFYITPYFHNRTGKREIQPFYISIHLPGGPFTTTRFHFQMHPKALNKLKEWGYYCGADFDLSGKYIFEGQRISDDGLLLATLSWSNLLQLPKYSDAAINFGNVPELQGRDTGLRMNEKLPLNSYWMLKIYLTKDRPLTTPGAAWGLNKSIKDHSSHKHLKMQCNDRDYYLAIVSKLCDALQRPVPEDLACPPAPAPEATRVLRCRFDNGKYPRFHETITTRAYRDQLAAQLDDE